MSDLLFNLNREDLDESQQKAIFDGLGWFLPRDYLYGFSDAPKIPL